MPSPLSASEQAYRYVKQLILDGRIASGEMISERQIVAGVSLSRTPVREAFLRLSTEGWLKLYPKRGALVVPIRPEEMGQVLQARHLIESHAMRSIAKNPAEAEVLGTNLLALTQRMQRAMEAGDSEVFTSLDTEFHLMIVRSAGNDILSDIYRGLRDRLRRMTARSIRQDEETMKGIVRDHTDLAHIVKSADAAGFDTRLMEHMRSAHDRNNRPPARIAAALRGTRLRDDRHPESTRV
jgi:DNA-binding GntR family transcriptional regulator